jgi:glycosyltransferase involved in cell wall biosynthesis
VTATGERGSPSQGAGGRACKPVFSVVIDNYNYAEYLEEALESVFGQSFPQEDVEIIVVDDGSTDDSRERIRRYADRVICICRENGGQASAFNVGIAEAKGDIVAFLDADDYWHPDKLRSIAREFERSERVDFVYHFMNVVDSRHKIVDRYVYPDPFSRGTGGPGRRYLDSYLAGRLPWFSPTSGMAVKAGCLKDIGPLPEDLRIGGDLYLHYILPFYMRDLSLIKEPLGYYRLHEENLSGGNLLTKEKVEREIRMLSFIGAHVERVSAEMGLDSSLLKIRLGSVVRTYEILGEIMSGHRAAAVRDILSFDAFLPEDRVFHRLVKKMVLITYVILPPGLLLWLQRRYRSGVYYLRHGH